MEHNPIFIPLNGIKMFPALRKGKGKHPLNYIDLVGKEGTLRGYCCKNITVKDDLMTTYGNGSGHGETQVLDCLFNGSWNDYSLMVGIMQKAVDFNFIVLVPRENQPPIVVGNEWAEMYFSSSYNSVDCKKIFTFTCPYAEDGTQRYGGSVNVVNCTPHALIIKLFGMKNANNRVLTNKIYNDMSKMKERIIAFVNSREAITTEDVKSAVESIYKERGLKPYDGSLCPGYEKGHWRTENRVTIYKTDCPNLPENSLRIYLSGYGIGDKSMFYSIDGIEFNALTRQDERDVKIWQDLNDGIVDKTYD